MKNPILVSIFLASIIWAVFGQTIHFDFVNYDDDTYVYQNPIIAPGLHWHGIAWVFTHRLCSNWHPITWVSHMLDCQLYGLHADGHHLTNVLLHAAAAITLFLWLQKLTGKIWRCAFVAAVFAIHPLRVESVAWIAERKDVLSGLFFMLTLWAYMEYVAKSKVQSPKSRIFYVLALAFFALGLMCKPMLVTLPFVLLLLDYWPLQRISGFRFPISDLKRLFIEKMPFLALALASCVVTFLAQEQVEAAVQDLTISWRIENAVVAYVDYLRQSLYPAGLAVFYPGTRPPLWKFGLSLMLLGVISWGVMAGRRKHPWLLVGWLWYLGMLVPVVGLVQVGAQAHADRYTYLPQIGLCLLAAWGASEFCRAWRYRRVLLGSAAVAVIGGLLVAAYVQTGCWKDSVTLWTHTLTCTSGNWVAHENLGNALFKQRKFAEAAEHYEQTIQLKPKDAQAQCDLGIALAAEGRTTEAMEHYQQALQINPDYADAHVNIGTILANQGNLDEAIKHFERAVQIKPDHARAHYNLGSALLSQGNWTEAVDHYQRALQINPDYTLACLGLGNVLASRGQLNKAIPYFQRAATLAADQGNFGLAQAIQAKLKSISSPSSQPQSP